MVFTSKWQRGILSALMGLALALGACRSNDQMAYGPSPTSPAAEPQVRLEAIRLPAPASEAQRAYLGVPAVAPFDLTEISTRILIIEFYSMYCPHCQREAPRVNRLFERITEDARLRSQIKLIGVAVGNTTYETDVFRQTYGVRFPLFADRTRVVANSLGVNRFPTFVGIAYRPEGGLHRFLSETGGFESGEEFLTEVIKRAGIDLSGS
jgi:peroxiredoxin